MERVVKDIEELAEFSLRENRQYTAEEELYHIHAGYYGGYRKALETIQKESINIIAELEMLKTSYVKIANENSKHNRRLYNVNISVAGAIAKAMHLIDKYANEECQESLGFEDGFKVRFPKETVWELDRYLFNHFAENLITDYVNQKLELFPRIKELTLEEVASAACNGYTVLPSKEELLIEAYQDAVYQMDLEPATTSEEARKFAEGKVEGLAQALKIMGLEDELMW